MSGAAASHFAFSCGATQGVAPGEVDFPSQWSVSVLHKHREQINGGQTVSTIAGAGMAVVGDPVRAVSRQRTGSCT